MHFLVIIQSISSVVRCCYQRLWRSYAIQQNWWLDWMQIVIRCWQSVSQLLAQRYPVLVPRYGLSMTYQCYNIHSSMDLDQRYVERKRRKKNKHNERTAVILFIYLFSLNLIDYFSVIHTHKHTFKCTGNRYGIVNNWCYYKCCRSHLLSNRKDMLAGRTQSNYRWWPRPMGYN